MVTAIAPRARPGVTMLAYTPPPLPGRAGKGKGGTGRPAMVTNESAAADLFVAISFCGIGDVAELARSPRCHQWG